MRDFNGEWWRGSPYRAIWKEERKVAHFQNTEICREGGEGGLRKTFAQREE